MSAPSRIVSFLRSPPGAIVAAGVIVCVFVSYFTADWYIGLPAESHAQFVGRKSCVECHADQARKFAGSHHDKAMDLATEETVLGDFNEASLEHYGVTSRMFRRDGKFFVNTEGPEGTNADFEVKYVFGVEPLQQYMVEFDRAENALPHEIGRVQVLRVSWDTQRKKWFHLDPPDVREKLDPTDDLHWTGIAQRWNNMCADCHSTNLQRNFDVATSRYRTTFSEIDVSCEACHGPGSLHVQMAETPSPFWDRKLGYAIASLKGKENTTEIETCAQCHSRRRIAHADFRPGASFHDFFEAELLNAQTYHADGQNLDEVYEYGSFVQSKMFHKNIRCGDCHDSHSAQLKHEGNKLCTSCHAHPAGKYDSPAHHRHAPGTPGASCVECHMPASIYMAVDSRRDHGLRVPRPDLSLKHGTPNACSACHIQDVKDLSPEKKKTLTQYADWLVAAREGDGDVIASLEKIDRYCAEGLAKWYPPQKRKEDVIVPALTLARRGDAAAIDPLREIVRKRDLPAIARATALSELAQFGQAGVDVSSSIEAALHDAHAEVRTAGVIAAGACMEASELRAAIAPLLGDSARIVRAEAARTLAPIANEGLNAKERKAFHAAFEEYLAALRATNDRAAAHLAEGSISESLGRFDQAEALYRTALRLEPRSCGARSNLAALLDRRSDALRQEASQAARSNDRETAEKALAQLEKLHTEATALRREELDLTQRDALLAPRAAGLQYRLGLLLYLHERLSEAEAALAEAARLEPLRADFHMALALLREKRGDLSGARKAAEEAYKLSPKDEGYRETVERLQRE